MARPNPPLAATPAPAPPDSAAQNRNLLLRAATALVLLAIVLPLTWLGGVPFALMVAVASAINAGEASAMSLWKDRLGLFAVAAAFAMPLFFVVPVLGERHLHWLWAGLVVVTLTVRLLRDRPVDSAGRDVAAVLLCGIYGSLLGYVVPLRLLGEGRSWTGAGWLLAACAMTWGGDTGAYFAGRFLGRHKLYPRISPAKTWEGFFGGLATSIAMAFATRALALPQLSFGACLGLGFVGGVGGPVGDLAESMLKRAFHVKDSGKILPGHGGMLDRVDARMLNAPLVYFYAQLFSR